MFGWAAVHEPHEVTGEEEDGPPPDPPLRGGPAGETFCLFVWSSFVFLALLPFCSSTVKVYIIKAKEVILFVFNLLKRELSESGRDEWNK